MNNSVDPDETVFLDVTRLLFSFTAIPVNILLKSISDPFRPDRNPVNGPI